MSKTNSCADKSIHALLNPYPVPVKFSQYETVVSDSPTVSCIIEGSSSPSAMFVSFFLNSKLRVTVSPSQALNSNLLRVKL